jgi:hypothetical protein
MRLARVYNAIKPRIELHRGKRTRADAGMTLAAARSPNAKPCRYCGAPLTDHSRKVCVAPVPRGWGWPGWENVT